MNKQLTKKTIGIAASAALMASLAFSGSAFAGKPDRNPSEKDCPFVGLDTACSDELQAAYDLVGSLLTNGVFLSRNPDRDSGTLQCKISGAEIKFATGKADEAQWLVQDSLDKILVLLNQGKLSQDGYDLIKASFDAAQDCVGSPTP
jgi:hypothetical protein